MRRMVLIGCLCVSACNSGQGGNIPANPLMPGESGPSGSAFSLARWDDRLWPSPPSEITWIGPYFSWVRVTNRSGHIQAFTMALFTDVRSDDIKDQHLIRAVTRIFQVGETATFGFDMSDECGTSYQRDVWESAQVGVGRLYAEGGPLLQGRCNGEPRPGVPTPQLIPPPPPPPSKHHYK